MSDIVIREVANNVWTFSRPFARFPGGFGAIGGRSTAIKLQSQDGVWIFVSTPLSVETKEAIDKLGPVRYIVGPNRGHYLYLKEFHNAYPEAKLLMPQIGFERASKNGVDGLKLAGAWGKDPQGTTYGFEEEIEHCHFSGFMNQDVAFLHKPSGTLIEADLLMNLPAKEQYQKSDIKPSFSVGSDSWLHGLFIRFGGSNKEAMRRDAKTVNSWNFDRIIPCHGDVIETGGKSAWQKAYAQYLQ